MSDLTSRLSKAVFDYLETANLRQEPFSLSRIEEVIAGVMAMEVERGKLAGRIVTIREVEAKRKAQQEPPTIPNETIKAYLERKALIDANLKRQVAEPKSVIESKTYFAPVTYDLSKDPDAFKKARVGDMIICEIGKDLVGYGDHQKWSCHRIMNSECNRWTRIA